MLGFPEDHIALKSKDLGEENQFGLLGSDTDKEAPLLASAVSTYGNLITRIFKKMSMDFEGEALIEKHVEDKCFEKVLYGMGQKLVNGKCHWTNKRGQKETQKRRALGLNSDEEDEAIEAIEEEDDKSIHDVLGSDENKDHDSEYVVSLDKDDDSLDVSDSDKEVSKDDDELSEGHSEEPVNKGKGSAATSEDIEEDDLDDVPLA
ncbi:hypothetical protein LIER_23565 [Lithospermum erythrorhizon]|uniref:Uncharacterized protein n=1 Tax=Lithospermum erythrorhizon TaxID=34254 RepID=A0AAV3R154_LITER